MRNFLCIINTISLYSIIWTETRIGKCYNGRIKRKKKAQMILVPWLAVLFEKGKTFFEYKQDNGFFVMTEVEVKIKIYKKEGYEYANKAISYYVGGNSDESIDFSKAITYNLVNGVIEKTKLKSEGEFNQQKKQILG